jgi:hypothetical protein
MLEFSQDTITFTYIDEKKHPETNMSIANKSSNTIYFKVQNNVNLV